MPELKEIELVSTAVQLGVWETRHIGGRYRLQEMAGRCSSGTSRGHASFRGTGDCVAAGQAAGTASAIAVRKGIAPSELDPAILVQQWLTDGGCL